MKIFSMSSLRVKRGNLLLIILILLSSLTYADKTVDPRIQTLKDIFKLFEKLPSRDLQKKELAAYDKQKAPLFTKISANIDYDHITFASFPEQYRQKFWKGSTGQKEFQKLLQEIIEEVAYPASQDFLKKVKIKYHEDVVKKEDIYIAKATVLFEAKNKDEEETEYELEFHFFQKDNKWVIRDIVFDEDSWVEMFRDTFLKFMKDNKEDYTKLTAEMNKTLEKAKRGESILDQNGDLSPSSSSSKPDTKAMEPAE